MPRPLDDLPDPDCGMAVRALQLLRESPNGELLFGPRALPAIEGLCHAGYVEARRLADSDKYHVWLKRRVQA